jgi:hypothetical protein
MRATQWIEWTRTRLEPRERDELLSALTSEQKAHLIEHDYDWAKGVGVLWKPTDGALRRARFTHGTHFRTQHGEFYINSEGNAHEPSDHRLESPTPAPRAPSLLDEPPEFENAGAATLATNG